MTNCSWKTSDNLFCNGKCINTLTEQDKTHFIHNKDVITTIGNNHINNETYYEAFCGNNDSNHYKIYMDDGSVVPADHNINHYISEFLKDSIIVQEAGVWACGGSPFVVFKVKNGHRTVICSN